MQGKLPINCRVGELVEYKLCSLELDGLKVHEMIPVNLTDLSLNITIERVEIPLHTQIALGIACCHESPACEACLAWCPTCKELCLKDPS